jgi:GNAT superfamily N-acetyltransferase
MLIRLADVNDAPGISALVRPLVERYIAHEFSEEGIRHLLASVEPAAIAGYLNSNFRYHVAEAEERLAGVVATRDNAHLYHLFVAEPFQGQGLARLLWETAKQACVAEGNRGEFTVNSSRYAQGVYRKFGFVEAGPAEERHGVISIPMKFWGATTSTPISHQ